MRRLKRARKTAEYHRRGNHNLEYDDR